MAGILSFESLKTMVASGDVDTVLVCLVDMQGRLMGKRFHAQNFVDSAYKETHCCNYLLATDWKWQRLRAMPRRVGKADMATMSCSQI